MKNLPFYLVLVFIGAMLFASCKKDFTCACTVGVPFVYDTVINVEIKNEKKRIAKKVCEQSATTIQTVSAAFISAVVQGFVGDSLLGGSQLPPNLIGAQCRLR